MGGTLHESQVGSVALAWLESLGWAVKRGPDLAPGGHWAERADYGEVVLAQRLRDALLPKLIDGEIRVKDPEKFLERAGV